LAGWLWMIGGLAYIANGLTNPASVVLVLAIAGVVVFAPFLYSYVIYRHIEGFDSNEEP
jgi:hypothetical protein